jgi:hypothetical protein
MTVSEWRVEKRPGFYSDLIWHDWGEDRQMLLAEVHQDGIADQIVREHDELAAAQARIEALERQVASVTGERDALRTAMENIHLNVKGLSDGMVPNIGADAVWYFKMIRGVAEAVLTAASSASQGDGGR